MTAVAPPPNIHSVSRPWSGGSQHSFDSMAADVFMPRTKRGSQPYGVPSSNSSTSTLENGVGSLGVKKKSWTRLSGAGIGGSLSNGLGGGWPKTDLNHPRSQIGAGAVSTTSSHASPVNGVHQPVQTLPSQHLVNGNIQQNGNGPQAYLMLLPLNGTFERKQIPLPPAPETLRIGRQTNAKTIPTPTNGFFDSKVLSRQHAEVWTDRQNKVWIRDVKSSNGTFVNGQRLSPENQESEAHELRAEDVLELGIDIVGEDSKTIVHHKVAARVEHAGPHGGAYDFGDVENLVNGNFMTPPMSAQSSLRGRPGQQVTRGQMPNGHAPPQPRPAVMMPAVTMEMVVKKLNAELQSAKQQSNDLQRTAEIFDVILASASVRDLSQSLETKEKPTSHDQQQPNGVAPHSKALFVPARPLPTTELSRVGSPDVHPSSHSIKSDRSGRSDKPDPPQQLLSLVDKLAKATKEMEAKTLRVQDLEEALKRERKAREEAEDRAAQLENASRALRGKTHDQHAREQDQEKKRVAEEAGLFEKEKTATPPTTDRAAIDSITQAAAEAVKMHQKRMEDMIKELQSTREKMEEYRLRAEQSERQHEEDRKTLSEMIQSLRREADEREQRAKERIARSSQTEEADVESTGTQVIAQDPSPSKSKDLGSGPLSPVALVTATAAVGDKSTLMLSRRDAAPYASMLGVMLFGVGLMAVINGWQRGDR